jgi:hypothetical protein
VSPGVGKVSGLSDVPGDFVELHVLCLGDAGKGAEGGICVDLVAFHDDAFGLADDVAVDDRTRELFCSLGFGVANVSIILLS